MSRLPRYILPGQPQHVIQRGNNRSAMFAGRDDYVVFCRWLADAAQTHGCFIHAYVLMTNHVHLLITPLTERAIGMVMQSVGRRYVRYFNRTYGRTGTLWEGRYRASLVDSDRYLLTCQRYIEANPVRSGQVATPEEYPWSSFHANALGERDRLVTTHELYAALGADAESRCAAYRALLLNPVDEPTLDDIREATNRGWPLGNDPFRTAVATVMKRRAQPRPRGGDRRSEAYQVAGHNRGAPAPMFARTQIDQINRL
ncbi:MAG: transposase [Gemmatimonadaceae bacterium]